MYRSASNVRIGLKCTESASNVQINKFLTFDLSIYQLLYIWGRFLYIWGRFCTFEVDLYIWGRFLHVHLRPIGLYRARASNPWASLADFTADRTPSPSRVRSASVHLRPIPYIWGLHLRLIPYIWGRFSAVHLRPNRPQMYRYCSLIGWETSPWQNKLSLPHMYGIRPQIDWLRDRILYIWGQFSIHLRPILYTFEADSIENVQIL